MTGQIDRTTVTSVVARERPAAGPAAPSTWVARWLADLHPGARALDFASGHGRHAALMARQGLEVWAVDRDAGAIESLRAHAGLSPARAIVADLETGAWPLPRHHFDVVVVTRYLHRPRFALLADLLAPGGRLIYETFADGQARFGRPTRDAFLLRPGELFVRCRAAGLHVMAYEDGVSGGQGGDPAARVQRICAQRAPSDPARFGLDARLG